MMRYRLCSIVERKMCWRRWIRNRSYTIIFLLSCLCFLLYTNTGTKPRHHPEVTKPIYRPENFTEANLTERLKQFAKELRVPECEEPNCEHRSFVFIKLMRVSSGTTAQVLRRFLLVRQLHSVLPLEYHIYLGWPFSIVDTYRKAFVQPSALIEHSIYNRKLQQLLVPRDAKYLTIIRNPVTQVRSVYNYFNVREVANVQGDGEDSFNEYLYDYYRYEKAYTAPGAKVRYCIPNGFRITRNLQSTCLGMPLGFPTDANPEGVDERLESLINHADDISDDPQKVSEHINRLKEELDLVMIREYYDESMILLKRLMRWSFAEVLYRSVHQMKYSRQSLTLNAERVLRRVNAVDFKLYDAFNRTFWEKINREQGFYKELKEYRNVLKQVVLFCDSTSSSYELHVPTSVFSRSFVVSRDYCTMFMPEDLLSSMQSVYEELAPANYRKQIRSKDIQTC